MKIGSPEFLGKIKVNGTDYTIEWFAHILNNTMAYYEEKTYNIGDFVTHGNKWYYSIVNNNKNNPPPNENFWNEYSSGGGVGGMANEEVTENITAELQKRYVVTNINGVTINLPQGEETKTIAISAQVLNDAAMVTIIPFEEDTIANDDSLILDVSYSSVELVYLNGDWHVITPFMPQSISNAVTIMPGIITDYNASTRIASARPVNVVNNQWAGEVIQGLYANWDNPDNN